MHLGSRDAVVGGLSYMGGRLTAPVSGDEGKDREIADTAKENVSRGADKLSNAGEEGKEKVCAAFAAVQLEMTQLALFILPAPCSPRWNSKTALRCGWNICASFCDKPVSISSFLITRQHSECT